MGTIRNEKDWPLWYGVHELHNSLENHYFRGWLPSDNMNLCTPYLSAVINFRKAYVRLRHKKRVDILSIILKKKKLVVGSKLRRATEELAPNILRYSKNCIESSKKEEVKRENQQGFRKLVDGKEWSRSLVFHSPFILLGMARRSL